MNNTAGINNKRNSITLFLMFAFILLSNISFSQNQNSLVSVSNNIETSPDVKQDKNKAASMEFVLWFMGSKQDPNSTISTENLNTKKQIMTSGLAPNRLLIKAFLKKAVNFESALA